MNRLTWARLAHGCACGVTGAIAAQHGLWAVVATVLAVGAVSSIAAFVLTKRLRGES